MIIVSITSVENSEDGRIILALRVGISRFGNTEISALHVLS